MLKDIRLKIYLLCALMAASLSAVAAKSESSAKRDCREASAMLKLSEIGIKRLRRESTEIEKQASSLKTAMESMNKNCYSSTADKRCNRSALAMMRGQATSYAVKSDELKYKIKQADVDLTIARDDVNFCNKQLKK